MEGILQKKTSKPEMTEEYLARLYMQEFDGCDNENVIFYNRAYQGGCICSCGKALPKDIAITKCSNCGTTKKVIYANRTGKPAKLVTVIYYRPEVVDDNSFQIVRYELVYIIDETEKKVTKMLREHSRLIYCNCGNEEEIYLIINKKKEEDITKFVKYRINAIARVYDNEIAEILNCKGFCEKTRFKEFVSAENRWSKWGVHKLVYYLDYYKKNKGIAVLLKSGFDKVALGAFEWRILLKEDTINNLMKLPEEIASYIKEKRFHYQDVEFLEKICKIQSITKKEVEWVYKLKESLYDNSVYMHLETLFSCGYSLQEIIDYTKQADLGQAIPISETLSLLSNYVYLATLAGLPYDRFPNSLKKAHDLMRRAYMQKMMGKKEPDENTETVAVN